MWVQRRCIERCRTIDLFEGLSTLGVVISEEHGRSEARHTTHDTAIERIAQGAMHVIGDGIAVGAVRKLTPEYEACAHTTYTIAVWQQA